MQAVRALAEALRSGAAPIKSLRLECCGLGNASGSLLAEGLAENGSLACLDLNCNSIGNLGAMDLAEALRVNRSLEDLYLQRNCIGDAGAGALAAAKQAREIHVAIIGNDISKEGLRAIEEDHESSRCAFCLSWTIDRLCRALLLMVRNLRSWLAHLRFCFDRLQGRVPNTSGAQASSSAALEPHM